MEEGREEQKKGWKKKGRNEWKEGKGRKEEKRGGKEGARLTVCQALGWGFQVGQRVGREAGAEEGSCQRRAKPLESCYCLRSLLREAPSKKSLLERPRLETSCSQRASEPCEMT